MFLRKGKMTRGGSLYNLLVKDSYLPIMFQKPLAMPFENIFINLSILGVNSHPIQNIQKLKQFGLNDLERRYLGILVIKVLSIACFNKKELND